MRNVCIWFGTCKDRRMNQSRSFAVLFDKLSRIERQIDPNKKLSIPIDSYVELHMCRT